MRSRSASATADKMVKTSLEMPLPVTSPPRSIMWRLTPRFWIWPRTWSASRADRNMRSSFGVISTSRRQQPATFWSVPRGFGAGDTSLDEDLVQRQAEHHGVALDDLLLGAEAF